MAAGRAQVIAAAAAAFPASDAATILAIVDLYGSQPHERERERVQLAVIALSEGSEDKLLELVQVARTDYRDVLSWVGTGPLPEAQGLAQRQAAQRLIERWGKK